MFIYIHSMYVPILKFNLESDCEPFSDPANSFIASPFAAALSAKFSVLAF